MKGLMNELQKMNVHLVTPEQENILANGELDKIFEALKGISNKYPNENFNMLPKLVNVRLVTGEVCEAIANANFLNGNIELMGIYLYDYTKLKYEELYAILQSYFKTPPLK